MINEDKIPLVNRTRKNIDINAYLNKHEYKHLHVRLYLTNF